MSQSIRQRAVKGFLGLGTYRLIGQGMTWAVSILIARILRPEDYGLNALATVFLNLFSFISEFGLSSALVQREHLDEEQITSAFWFTVALNVVIYGVIAVAAYPVASFYQSPRLASVIQVLGLTFLLSAIRVVPFSLMTRELEFTAQAKAEFFSGVGASISMYLMAVAGLGVWSLVLGSVCQSLYLTILFFVFRPWRPRGGFRAAAIRSMLQFGAAVNISKFLGYVSDNMDNLIVGKVLGANPLGLYNMAFVIGTMPIKRAGAMVYHVAFPVFSRLQSEPERLARYYLRSTRYLAHVAFPAGVGLFLVAEPFIRVVLHERWLPMLRALQLLCAVGIVKALATTLAPLLYATDRADLVLRNTIATSVLLTIGFFIGAHFGINGVALAWCLIYPVLFGALLIASLRSAGFSLGQYASNLLPPSAATALMGAAVSLFAHFGPADMRIRLFGSVGIGLVTYALGVWIFDRPLVQEGIGLARGALAKRREP